MQHLGETNLENWQCNIVANFHQWSMSVRCSISDMQGFRFQFSILDACTPLFLILCLLLQCRAMLNWCQRLSSNLSKNNLQNHWHGIMNWPSASSMTSSKRSKVSGAGCKRDIKIVALLNLAIFRMHLTIWYVVELSRPVEISSANKTFLEPTIISPVRHKKYQGFLWPG